MRVLLATLLGLMTACGLSSTGGEEIAVGKKTADCPTGAVAEAKLQDDAQLATDDLGIRVGLADQTCRHPGVDCEPMEEDQGKLAEAFLASLREDLGRYPKDFLRRHGPRRIWLVRELKMDGVKWEAGGVTLGSDRSIYLNLKAGCSAVARSLVIQHEFFHVLDPQLFVNESWQKAWNDLNPAGFRYGADYNKVDDYELHSQKGFASSYATTNAFEDRAETFAFAAVKETKAMLEGWAKDDEHLAKKDYALQYWLRYTWPELAR